MKILFFGDIVGHIGLKAVSDVLPSIKEKEGIDFVIANGENASDGFGLTEEDYRYLVEAGVDAITLGNHYDSKRELSDYIDEAPALVRPLNLLRFDRGEGTRVFSVNGVKVQVTNILGTAFMKETVASPIAKLSEIIGSSANIHIVDYHGESTSEKALFAFYFDGRVSAIVGTHTHVQTADEQILPHGTGFISDCGYCGAYPSVIGFEKASVIDRIVFGSKQRMRIDEEAKPMVNALILDIRESDGKTIAIKRLRLLEGKEVSNA